MESRTETAQQVRALHNAITTGIIKLERLACNIDTIQIVVGETRGRKQTGHIDPLEVRSIVNDIALDARQQVPQSFYNYLPEGRAMSMDPRALDALIAHLRSTAKRL